MGVDGNLKMKTRQALQQLAPWPEEGEDLDDDEAMRQGITTDLVRQFQAISLGDVDTA